jgi:hypothetical protein
MEYVVSRREAYPHRWESDQLLSKNRRTGQLGIDRAINNPSFTTAPEVGKSPLGLWESDEKGMYAGNYPGNAIVGVIGGRSKEPTTGARPLVMTAWNPHGSTPSTPAATPRLRTDRASSAHSQSRAFAHATDG